jgi:signal transduction histidine kinase
MSGPFRVLYAEDNDQDADLTRFHFSERAPDLELEIVVTGRGCLDRVSVAPPDVLLLDNHLPDMDGLDVLRSVVRRRVPIPVVLVTGAGDEDLVVKALRLGATNYVPKAGNYLETLPDLLRTVVERHRLGVKDVVPGSVQQRILYVEHDEADIDLALRHFAEAAPHLDLEVVRSSAAALARLAAAPSLDAVILDLRMPDLSGLDVVREAGRRRLPLPPFIMITGKGDEEAASASVKLGAVDYVLKRAGYLDRLVYVIDRAITHDRLRHLNAELKLQLAERRRVEEALRDANARLGDADRRKDEFIAILSHELRNPLAPIRYALPLFRRGELDETAARALGVVERQVEHLTRLVDDLLDVSRITRGQIELRQEYVTLGSILTSAVEPASPAIAAARHTLELSVPDEPIWLYADPARVAQIVTNLLNNSAKYTPRGGRIILDAAREESEAVVRVRDTGIGIPPEALPNLFEMFHQVTARADKSAGGLGIGLSLVKRLVEMHGGTVEAHSAGVGQGSEFVVRLPIAGDAQASEECHETPAAPEVGRRLKVLVVDDNADLVDMLATVVTELGHDVRKALDGRSAVAAARAYRPDVVLLDLGLPVMNGIEVARELRRLPDGAGLRLVALTGWGQPEDRRQTQEAGFDQHLTKPTDPKTLAALLARYAAERGERR